MQVGEPQDVLGAHPVGEPQQQRYCRGEADPPDQADLGQSGQRLRQAPDLPNGLEGTQFHFPAGQMGPPGQKSHHDHQGDHCVADQGTLLVPVDPLVEDPQGHRRPQDARQVGEPSDHQGGQRSEQQPESQVATDRQADHPGPQEQGQEGQRSGECPHQGLDGSDRNAQRRGPVGAFGRGPYGDPQIGPPQQGTDRRQNRRRKHQHQKVVGVQPDGADIPHGVDGHADALRRHPGVPPPGHQQGKEGQRLSQAEGGDGDH